jgi:hypothetical protein
MVYALSANRSGLFAISAGLGILARESTLFLVPAYVATRRWRAVAGILGVSGAALVVPRLLIPASAGYQGFALPHSWTYFAQAYLSFGILWMPMLTGPVLCRREAFPAVGASFGFLILGALVSSANAADTARMYAIMLPVAVVCWTVYLDKLGRHSRGLMIFTLALAVLNIPLALPTRFLPGIAQGMIGWEDFYLRLKLPVALLHASGLAIGILGMVVLRRELTAGFREKKAWMLRRR